MTADTDIVKAGMLCLLENLGVVGTERLISTLSREKFDYTEWQREHFDAMSDEEFLAKMTAFEQEHPYTGKGVRI